MENGHLSYQQPAGFPQANTQESVESRRQEALREANILYEQRVDWLEYFRKMLGVDGVIRQLFPEQDEYAEFEKSDEFAQIEKMLLLLRAKKVNPKPGNEPTRVITVRLPESIHAALHTEATDHGTSVNKLCISKLLQSLSLEFAQSGIETKQGQTPKPNRANPATELVQENPLHSTNPSLDRYSSPATSRLPQSPLPNSVSPSTTGFGQTTPTPREGDR